MDRPLMQKSGQELFTLAENRWDELWELGQVAYELQYRRQVSRERKAEVVERLIELGLKRGLQEAQHPGFEFPSTSIHETRRRLADGLNDVDWRETGLLSLSGYQVGKIDGKPADERRRILNYLFLEDDLRDVTDLSYAAEWGPPKTSRRLRKLSETIAALTRNAKRNPVDMSRAISDWEADLDYLKETFYENWGGFPWPDVNV